MSKASRRRRAREVVAHSSYPRPAGPHPTGEPPAAPSLAASLGFIPFSPASAPEIQRRDERSRMLREALGILARLAAARDEARRIVVEHDERVRSAVVRLRLDGADWGQIGSALGISRQGARQRFDLAARAARRIREARREAAASHDDLARPDA